ncbi:YciI family protein [Pseudoxanthomonas sp. 10H]|uniref:YciI family protein n=1 Tax=Pseudoxanthomonas sp. 10H TaxID=3242729 RepID=UPI0035578BB5
MKRLSAHTHAALLAVAFAIPSLTALPAVAAATPVAAPAYDAALARRTGADEHGMRPYVLVVLKTGPRRMPDGEARNAMFAGHFANMERLAEQGKLVLAGPFMKDPAGWRGLFVFAVADLEEARRLTESDPVIVSGEMVAEYHPWYGSAANMLVPELHKQLVPPSPPASSP